MSTSTQLRMHAGASDTHIPRPLLGRAADEIDDLRKGLKEVEFAADTALGSISGATSIGAEARKRFEKIILKARSFLANELGAAQDQISQPSALSGANTQNQAPKP